MEFSSRSATEAPCEHSMLSAVISRVGMATTRAFSPAIQCRTGHQSISYLALSNHTIQWIHTSVHMAVCMYVCTLEWERIHQGTGSIKVGQVEWFGRN
jgi:hypothetical protein